MFEIGNQIEVSRFMLTKFLTEFCMIKVGTGFCSNLGTSTAKIGIPNPESYVEIFDRDSERRQFA